MEIKQRKVCGMCRCYSPVNKRCTIGYDTKYKKNGFDIIIDAIPLEPCPKPLTANESLEAMINYKK